MSERGECLSLTDMKRNGILYLWKLEMHGNQKTTYGAERQVDGWNMSV